MMDDRCVIWKFQVGVARWRELCCRLLVATGTELAHGHHEGIKGE